MSIRLYLDENVNTEVADYLKSKGFDAETARDAGLLGVSDEDQLAYASASNRAFYTHDLRAFQRLARLWIAEGKTHGGILYSSRRSPATVAQMIADACGLYEDLDDIAIWLPVEP